MFVGFFFNPVLFPPDYLSSGATALEKKNEEKSPPIEFDNMAQSHASYAYGNAD